MSTTIEFFPQSRIGRVPVWCRSPAIVIRRLGRVANFKKDKLATKKHTSAMAPKQRNLRQPLQTTLLYFITQHDSSSVSMIKTPMIHHRWHRSQVSDPKLCSTLTLHATPYIPDPDHSQTVQVSLWYILRPPKYPISIYHNDTWTLWDSRLSTCRLTPLQGSLNRIIQHPRGP